MTRPRPGEEGHTEWVVSRLRPWLAEHPRGGREAFLAHERETAGGGIGARRGVVPPYVTKRDVWCSWTRLVALARGEDPPEPIRAPATLPLPAVPPGYHVARVSTQTDETGAVDRQWVEAPLEREPGELHTPIPDGHVVRGVSTLVSGSGATLAQWVKTAREPETRAQVLDRLLRELPTAIPERVERVDGPGSVDTSDLLAVYPMGDPHVGMLSWAPETGESHDLDSAREIMCAAMTDLVQRGPRTEKALIVNLGDYFHADNHLNRTSRSGHPLDVDGRWPKVLQTGIEILVYMIDRALEHHRHVRVINEIGNHDDHSAIMLSVALAAHYRNEPRVEIDLSPSAYHWHRFGKVLIGVTHGHNQRHSDLEAIMAAERAADWGETVHRYWYCGHIHHSTKKEQRGCVIESFRTLAPRDAWAAGAGYRAGRDMNRILLHREWGEVGRDIVSAAYLQSQYLARSAA